MSALPVEASDDPRLAPFARLRVRGQRPDPELLFAESEIAAQRLVQGGLAPVAAAVTSTSRAGRVSGWWPASAPLLLVPRSVLAEVLGYDLHRGCVVAGRRPDLTAIPWERVARADPLVVVGEGLGDPANVGALARSCAALGGDLLLLDPRGADPFTPRAVRAAMGTSFLLPLAVPPDLTAAVRAARERLGARVIAAVADPTATPLAAYRRPPGPALLLLGNEGRGLSTELLALADDAVTVPMTPGVDSLNVAAASAVFLYGLAHAP